MNADLITCFCKFRGEEEFANSGVMLRALQLAAVSEAG